MSDRDANCAGAGSADPAVRPHHVAPLHGRTVLLVHPAWHSCGSHKVFVTQAQAYRALGARILALAIADFPGHVCGSAAHAAYFEKSSDLHAERRYFAGMPSGAVFTPAFLRSFRDWLHGNYAAMLIETVKQARLPIEQIEAEEIDLIHCNHFFCMSAATKLRGNRDCPILLDTHDLQARQFVLRRRSFWTLPPAATYESMLALELANMEGADVLLHMNAEEAASFDRLLPHKQHVLMYPAVEAVPPGRGGSDIIIVASANYPNFLGISWFLREVAPLIPDTPIKIVGNIDRQFRRRAPRLFREHAAMFTGYVADLNKAYAEAAAVLLPTTEGFGISIKTIEALSSGAPLIATPSAFRGMDIDAASLANVTTVCDPPSFAAAIRRVDRRNTQDRASSPTRQLYERVFSPPAYRHRIATLAGPLVANKSIQHRAGKR